MGDGAARPSIEPVQQEFAEAGNEAQRELRTYLIEGTAEASYAKGAERLGMTEQALRKAVERLRNRYQEAFSAGDRSHGGHPSEVDDELRYLQTVMRR